MPGTPHTAIQAQKSRAAASPAPLLLYLKHRPSMSSADIILWKGNGIISKAIRLYSKYSHASQLQMAEVQGCATRVCVLEAVRPRVRLIPLSVLLQGYKGQAYWMRVDANKIQRIIASQMADDLWGSGTRYDLRGLFRNLLGRFSSTLDEVWCSEMIHSCACHAGYGVDDGYSAWPGDLPQLIPHVEIVKIYDSEEQCNDLP